jgi:hypothetical protein
MSMHQLLHIKYIEGIIENNGKGKGIKKKKYDREPH